MCHRPKHVSTVAVVAVAAVAVGSVGSEEEDDDDYVRTYDDDDEVPSCCSFDVTTCESSLRMRDGLGLHRKPSLRNMLWMFQVRTYVDHHGRHHHHHQNRLTGSGVRCTMCASWARYVRSYAPWARTVRRGRACQV